MDEGSQERERVSLEELREWAGRMVEVSTLRAAAQQLGMSAEGLRRFIRSGSAPHLRTRRTLEASYLRANEPAPPRRGGGEGAAVRDALALLTAHLPAAARAQVRDRIVALVAGETLARGEELPAWLRGAGGKK